MVFSTNQNRQFYAAAEAVGKNAAGKVTLTKASTKGAVQVGVDVEGRVFIAQNGYGGIVRSDLINPKSIMWATASAPADMAHVLKQYKLELATGTTLRSGQDYILRINFRQFYGMSDEDIYQKYGAVHCTAAMVSTPANFWKELAYSVVKNFGKENNALEFVIAGKVIAKATKVNGEIKFYDAANVEINASSASFLTINEKSQVDEWALGTKQLQTVQFEVIPTTVYDADGNEYTWGKVTDTTYTSGNPTLTPVGNGYNIADLEYFCMGERGDQYRNVMWPKSIPTKYFVDATKTYYVLDIHYAYKGTCEDIQNSEKTMTIVADTQGTLDTIISDMGIGDKVKYSTNWKTNTSGGEVDPENP